MYRPQTAGVSRKADQDFIKHIKANHFGIEHQGCGNSFVSEAVHKFDYKGQASQLRASLDVEKKNDLRNSHFNIGGNKRE